MRGSPSVKSSTERVRKARLDKGKNLVDLRLSPNALSTSQPSQFMART